MGRIASRLGPLTEAKGDACQTCARARAAHLVEAARIDRATIAKPYGRKLRKGLGMTGQSEGPASAFWQDAPGYHGVLAVVDPWRLAISPNGKRYLLQERDGDCWTVRRWRKLLSLLLPDLPADLRAVMPEGLPEWPETYPRPWVEAVEARRQRVERARWQSDAYAGEIRRCGNARVCIRADGQRYLLQVADGPIWRQVASASYAYPLWSLVASWLPPEHRAAEVAGNWDLANALKSLPDRAADYRGAKPERIATAAKLPDDDRRARRATREKPPALRERHPVRPAKASDSPQDDAQTA